MITIVSHMISHMIKIISRSVFHESGTIITTHDVYTSSKINLLYSTQHRGDKSLGRRL